MVSSRSLGSRLLTWSLRPSHVIVRQIYVFDNLNMYWVYMTKGFDSRISHPAADHSNLTSSCSLIVSVDDIQGHVTRARDIST